MGETVNMSTVFCSIFLLLLLTTKCISIDVATASCGGGFDLQSGNYCYAYVHESKSWAEAGSVCRMLGGFLAEVQNSQQNNFIKMIMFDHREDIWLGAHDLVFEGRWYWATSGNRVGFTYWGPGQPNTGGRHENCMVFEYKSGRWHDYPCDFKFPFVCQKPITSAVVI